MTVLEVLISTTDYFRKRGLENPRLNAEHLMARALQLKRLDVYLAFERQLTENELEPLRDLVRRRGQREPLQHLLGTVEFCGQIFRCDKRALVPRPETEQLVELVQAELAGAEAKILDVGTGSGVIALALAAKLPQTRVLGVDISPEALTLARENAEALGLSDRVSFAASDLLGSVEQGYDAIVANLPYVSRHDRAQLAPEVLCDPEVALFGGEKGDEMVLALIATAPEHLLPSGLLALEIGLGQDGALRERLADKNYHDICAKTDYGGVTRFLLARYG